MLSYKKDAPNAEAFGVRGSWHKSDSLQNAGMDVPAFLWMNAHGLGY